MSALVYRNVIKVTNTFQCGKYLNKFDFIIIFLIPKLSIKLMHVSSTVVFFNSTSGFGVSRVIGFNLFPKPAHNINAVLIFILFTKRFWKVSF